MSGKVIRAFWGIPGLLLVGIAVVTACFDPENINWFGVVVTGASGILATGLAVTTRRYERQMTLESLECNYDNSTCAMTSVELRFAGERRKFMVRGGLMEACAKLDPEQSPQVVVVWYDCCVCNVPFPSVYELRVVSTT